MLKLFKISLATPGLTQIPRIVGLVEHVETSAEVQQWLMEQEEEVSVTMCGCGQTSSASASV